MRARRSLSRALRRLPQPRTLTMHGPTVTPMASAQPYLAGTPPPYANALYVNVNGSDPQIWYTAANSGTTCLANYDIASANGACATASPGPAGLSTDGSSYVYAAGATAPFYYQFNPLGFLTQINSCSTYCGSVQRFGLLADDRTRSITWIPAAKRL